MEENRERRLVIVSLSIQLLTDLLEKGWRGDGMECIEGLPQDAVCIGSFTDHPRMSANFIFYHPSFDIVPLEGEIPKLAVTYRRYYREND